MTFVVDSNQALTLHFVHSSRELPAVLSAPIDQGTAADQDTNTASTLGGGFHPEFTHQVFGENELIAGYKNLSVKLLLSAGSLLPHLHVTYTKRASPRELEGAEPTDIATELAEWIEDIVPKADDFGRKVDRDRAKFTPVGDKIAEYKAEGDTTRGRTSVFEIYKADGELPEVQRFHNRVQALSVFFIEAASLVDDYHRWEMFYVFEKITESGETYYATVGYATCYRFFYYDRVRDDLGRLRIAQFVIFPPYQGQQHGSRLYNAITEDILSRSDIVDLTVEGPTPKFQRMRDLNDLARISLSHVALAKAIKIPIIPSLIKELREKTKLCKHQAWRCAMVFCLRNLRAGGQDQEAFEAFLKKRLAKDHELTISKTSEHDRQMVQDQIDALYESELSLYRSLLERVPIL